MRDIVVYHPPGKRGAAAILAAMLRDAGYRVRLVEAGDARDVVLVGPFGTIRGLGEAIIVANQLAQEADKP